MAGSAEHTHHIKLRSTQMEMPTGRPSADEDYEGKLRAAQEELDRIQQQREELERKKLELEELTTRKHTFVSQQIELSERLTNSLTMIDRELVQIRQEAEDLQQCRVCFAAHLEKLDKVNPENWNRDNLSEKLDRASMIIDVAADEYDQAAAHFEGTRSGAIFGRASKKSRARIGNSTPGEFMVNLRNGFAFNLPVLVLGGTALIIFLLK